MNPVKDWIETMPLNVRTTPEGAMIQSFAKEPIEGQVSYRDGLCHGCPASGVKPCPIWEIAYKNGYEAMGRCEMHSIVLEVRQQGIDAGKQARIEKINCKKG